MFLSCLDGTSGGDVVVGGGERATGVDGCEPIGVEGYEAVVAGEVLMVI